MLTSRDLQQLLPSFIDGLSKSGSSRSTIKNYASDLRKVIEALPQETGLDGASLNKSLASLEVKLAPATIRRLGFSLKAFSSWLTKKGYSLEPAQQISQTTTNSSITSPLTDYKEHLVSTGAAQSTTKIYSAAVASFFLWLRPDFKESQSLTEQNIQKVSAKDIDRYTSYLRSKSVSESSISSNLAALKEFFALHKDKVVYETNPVTQTRPQGPGNKKQAGFLLLGALPKLSFKKPRFWHAYRGHPMSDYVNWAASAGAILIVGLLVWEGLFAPKPIDINNLKTEIKNGLVLAATPPRILSFQGRLTDPSGNPVTTSTNIVFRVWDQSSGGTEGDCSGFDEDCLWKSKTWNVTPDQNGVFAVQLGDTGQSDTAIPAQLFSDYAELYLGVTIGADSEATPRQRIASSSYALNSDSLDGIDSLSFLRSDTSDNFTSGTLTTDGGTTLDINGTLAWGGATISEALGMNSQNITGLGTNLSASAGLTIGTGSNGNINLSPNGSGDIVFSTDTDTNIQASAQILSSSSLDLVSLTIDNRTSSGTQRGIVINHIDNPGAGPTESLLSIDDTNNSGTAITDGIIISSTSNNNITDAIDVSDNEIDNAINVGANDIVGTTPVIDFTNFDVSGAGLIGAADLTLGLNDTSATISTQDTDENLTIDPNGTGTIFFHGATYGITSGGALTVSSCSGCGGGATAWDAIADPGGNGAINFGQTVQTLDYTITSANASLFSFNFTNNGGSAGTDSGVVINNASSSNASGDLNTENLLLIQQLDATSTGAATLVDNAIKIDSANTAGITDGIEITNSGGNITNALNIVDTTGGTIDNGISLSGTFTTGISFNGIATTGVSVSRNAGTLTTGLAIAGASTTGISINGASGATTIATGIDLGGNQNGINITTGYRYSLNSSDFAGAVTGTDGFLVDLACGSCTTGSTTLTNGFRISASDAGETITNGINFGGATGITNDIVLQNSESIINDVDGEIEISGVLSIGSGTSNVGQVGLWSNPTVTAVVVSGAYGINSSPTLTASATNFFGLAIQNPAISGAGAITNNYGLYLANQTRGSSTDYGIYLEGADTAGICFDCDGTYTPTTVTGGIRWGSDANLVDIFRSASNTLSLGSNDILATPNLTLTGFNCTTSANGGALTTNSSGVVSCSDDDSGGGGATLQTAYDAGNTITTTTARNIAFTLADVATPTLFSVTQQDPAGTIAIYLNNANASGTNTNGLFIEQTGAGTLTNGINVTNTSGVIANGIVVNTGHTLSGIPTGYTFTGTYTDSSNFSGVVGINLTPTINRTTNQTVFDGSTLIASTPTLSFSRSVAFAGTDTIFNSSPTISIPAGSGNTSTVGGTAYNSVLTTSNAGSDTLTLASYTHFNAGALALGAGTTITSLYGLNVSNALAAGTGTVGTAYGIHIAPQSIGGTNYGLCFDCDGTWTSSTVASGIQFGNDANATQIFRSGNTTLSFGSTTTLTATAGISLTSGGNGAVTIAPAGSGDLVISTDSDTEIQLSGSTSVIKMTATDNTGVINIQDASSNNIFEFKDLSTNFGGLAVGGAFASVNSYYAEEFNRFRTNGAGCTADTANARGGDGNTNTCTASTGPISVDVTTGTGATCAFRSVADSVGGYEEINATDGTGSAACLEYVGSNTANDAQLIFNSNNLPVALIKVRPSNSGSSNARYFVGLGNLGTAGSGTSTAAQDIMDTSNDSGVYFSNCTDATSSGTCGDTTWNVTLQNGSSVSTVDCGVTISTSNFAVMRIEVVTAGASAATVNAYVDGDVSNGVSWTACPAFGSVTVNGLAWGWFAMTHANASLNSNFNFHIDFVRVWQDDAPSYPIPPVEQQEFNSLETGQTKIATETAKLLKDDLTSEFMNTLISSSSEVWYNSSGEIVAWINDKGEAFFAKVIAEVGDFRKLVFGEAVVKKEAKTAGTATFEAGATEVLIESDKVNEESLINLTAETKTNGVGLYVKEKKPGQGFVVALERNSGDQPTDATASATQAIKFTWFILNQE